MKNNTLKQSVINNYLTSKPVYSIKLADIGKGSLELDLFRQQIEWTRLHPMPFTAAKKKVLSYKSIFLGLGLLFLVLGVFIWMKTHILPMHYLLLGTFYVAKNVICGFCGLAGAASLLICYSLSTEKEIIQQMIRKAQRDLSTLYSRKKLEHGIKGYSWGNCDKSAYLLQGYRETHHKILDLKEETFLLFHRILHAEHLNGGKKEHLFNQAIMELDLKIEDLLHSFRNSR